MKLFGRKANETQKQNNKNLDYYTESCFHARTDSYIYFICRCIRSEKQMNSAFFRRFLFFFKNQFDAMSVFCNFIM